MDILQMKIELTGMHVWKSSWPACAYENRADRHARNLISDLICCYRGFLNAVSGRHASWNCFWTFGRYRKLLPAGCRASLICFCGHGGYFYIPKASLETDSFVWGWFYPEKIIPGRRFFRMGMNSPWENNPWRKILPNRDEFTLEKIIPGGRFFRMGMISLWNNNPQWKNLPNEDAYQLGKCIHGQTLFSWKICAASHRSIIGASWEALKVVIRVGGKSWFMQIFWYVWYLMQ